MTNMESVKDAIPKITQAERKLAGTCINCGVGEEFEKKLGYGAYQARMVLYCTNCGYWEPSK